MLIKLENLTKTYNTIHAVCGVNLEIPSNMIYGIIGLSGAGKSTLVRLISLLEKPDSGMIFYDNERVDNLTAKDKIDRRRHIGMIFQNFNLFSSRTAGKNIAYPMEICHYSKEEIKNRVDELLELVGLSDKKNAPVSTLSGGQKQRIAIARSLACKPDILFCDEATSALDPKTTMSILDLIKNIRDKMKLTVVMITHQMEVVRDCCDCVAVLSDGKIVEQGNVKSIFSKPKSKVTKDFISHLSSIVHWSESSGRYILRFPSSSTESPIITKLAKMYDVDFNIKGGGVQTVGEDNFGTLIVDIDGKEDAVRKTLFELKKRKIVVEEAKQ